MKIKESFATSPMKLHNIMCISIKKLMNTHGLKEVEFVKGDVARIIFDFKEGIVAIKADAVRISEYVLEARDIETGVWYNIEHYSDVVPCTIKLIYQYVGRVIGKSCVHTRIGYAGKDYRCRMVNAHDVNVMCIDGCILVAPESLNEILDRDDSLDNWLDQEIYYYTDEENLDLPYDELCEKLIEEGID